MAERTTGRVRQVGVDVQDTEENRGLIDAILADNPEVTLRRMPGMVKIQSHPQLIIRRSTVEEHIGKPWDTNEFQLAIISLSGNIAEWDEDEIVIRWEH
jgi:phenol hydroxylase P2 protein